MFIGVLLRTQRFSAKTSGRLLVSLISNNLGSNQTEQNLKLSSHIFLRIDLRSKDETSSISMKVGLRKWTMDWHSSVRIYYKIVGQSHDFWRAYSLFVA